MNKTTFLAEMESILRGKPLDEQAYQTIWNMYFVYANKVQHNLFEGFSYGILSANRDALQLALNQVTKLQVLAGEPEMPSLFARVWSYSISSPRPTI